jgi:methionine-rich copper-binding protein CopC
VKINKLIMSKIVVVLTTLLLSSTAWAHASANRSSPEDGEVLTESPAELSIQFDGPAKLISLMLMGSDKEQIKIDISEASSVDGLATVSMPSLQADSYKVVWRAMGIDGHATAGRFGFVISAP